MKDGNPYETTQLDEMRSEQRRVLRGFPDWLFAGGNRLPAADRSKEPDASYTETVVRAQAADRILRLRPLLDEWRAISRNARWWQFLTREVSDTDLTDQVRRSRSELVEDASSLPKDPPREVPPESSADVAQLLFLLQLADQLASDGYSDPRLRWST